MFLFLLMTSFALELEVVRAFQPLDESEGYYYVRPIDAAIDDTGRVHVLDPVEHRVTTYDAEGQVVRLFGRKGEGPGEFLFDIPEFSFIVTHGSRVLLCNEWGRVWIFQDGVYERTVNLLQEGGRIYRVDAAADGSLAVGRRWFSKGENSYNFELVAPNYEQTREIGRFDVKRWSGDDREWTLHAFYEPPFVWASSGSNEVLLGDPNESWWQVLGTGASDKPKRFQGKLPRERVNDEHKRLLMESPWMSRPNVKVQYDTDFLPPFREVVRYGEGFLALNRFPYTGRYAIHVLDGSGALLDTVELDLGPEGVLCVDRGRLIAVDSTSGDFTIRELTIR